MPELSLALPHGVDPVRRWRNTIRAHETFLTGADTTPDVRPLVLDSWRRSAAYQVDPDRPASPVVLTDDQLAEARVTHPLHRVMHVVRSLLIDHASDAGVIVVVSDADGRLLWAEGDRDLCRRAEGMQLVPGAAWREEAIGTNAIGTALAVNDTVQVFGSEHFTRSVQPWSCTAAPIHDPWSNEVIGVLDITGGTDVVSPQSAFLVRSAVAAIESELRFDDTLTPDHRTRPADPGGRICALGRDRGTLSLHTGPVEISLRHTELLLLLAAAPDGLSAGDLAWKLYEHDAAEVTVRAEISRLRKVVPGLISSAGRYRLTRPISTDAAEVANYLAAGDHANAVALYRGELLPRSTAPGIVTMRYRLHGWLRNVLLDLGDAESLRRYCESAAGRDDVQAWRARLERLSPGSPHHAEVSAILSELEATFGQHG